MSWMKIREASKYAGISSRTLRSWLKDGLSHSRLPSGMILIRTSWIDEYLERFKIEHSEAEKIAELMVEKIQH